MKYDLAHLTQEPDQKVTGPVQDDEALLLYALCRVMRIGLVVEIGVQNGYSTRNFLAAVRPHGGQVIGIDVCDHGFRAPGFTFIGDSAGNIDPDQIPAEIGLVFFDSHDLDAQQRFTNKMSYAKKISARTVLAVHDTNLHPGGVRHQPLERVFSNWLVDHEWSPFHAHTDQSVHGQSLPFRHGLSLFCKNKYLP